LLIWAKPLSLTQREERTREGRKVALFTVLADVVAILTTTTVIFLIPRLHNYKNEEREKVKNSLYALLAWAIESLNIICLFKNWADFKECWRKLNKSYKFSAKIWMKQRPIFV
jgi:hypothetical protein